MPIASDVIYNVAMLTFSLMPSPLGSTAGLKSTVILVSFVGAVALIFMTFSLLLPFKKLISTIIFVSFKLVASTFVVASISITRITSSFLAS